MRLQRLRFQWRGLSSSSSSTGAKRLRRPSPRWALALFRDSLPYVNLSEWRTALCSRREQRSWQERLLLTQEALLQRHVRSPFRHRMISVGSATLNTIEIAPTQARDDDATIVLTHGYGSGSAFWAPIMDALSQNGRRHVVAVDWNGMGASVRNPFPAVAGAEPEQYFVEPLEAWRQAMGLKKMILVGHSLGGLLSSQYAIRHPNQVARLVLVSPAGLLRLPDKLTTGSSLSSTTLRKRLVSSGWAKNITPQAIVRAAGPWGYRIIQGAIRSRFSHLDPVDIQLMSDYLYEVSAAPPGGEKALNALLVPILNDSHPGVFARNPIGALLHRHLPESIQVTIMFGDRDWMFNEDVRDLPLVQSARTKLIIVEESSHHLYLDNPKIFTDILLNSTVNDSQD